jgi:hypothetical protein
MYPEGDPFSKGHCNSCGSRLYDNDCFECDVQCNGCSKYMYPENAKLDRDDNTWCVKCYAKQMMILEEAL